MSKPTQYKQNWRLKMIRTPSYINIALPQHLIKRLTKEGKDANRTLEEQIVHTLEHAETNNSLKRILDFIDNPDKFKQAMLKALNTENK